MLSYLCTKWIASRNVFWISRILFFRVFFSEVFFLPIWLNSIGWVIGKQSAAAQVCERENNSRRHWDTFFAVCSLECVKRLEWISILRAFYSTENITKSQYHSRVNDQRIISVFIFVIIFTFFSFSREWNLFSIFLARSAADQLFRWFFICHFEKVSNFQRSFDMQVSK